MYHSKSPKIAARCRADGIVTEVLRNEFRLEGRLLAGRPLTSIADATSRSKMLSFMRKILDSGAALDWELDIAFEREVLPLFFSGYRTTLGMVVIGSAKSRPIEELHHDLLRIAEKEHVARGERPKQLNRAPSESIGDQLARLGGELLAAQQEVVKKNLDLEKQKIETLKNLGMIAHALRNPASGILSATEYLIEDAAEALGQKHVALLQSAARSSLSILQMIDEALEFSTIECGKLKVDLQPTDLVGLVKQSLILNERQAECKKIHLDMFSERPAIIADLDPVKFTQVIDNLLSNAIKVSRNDGRIEVRIAVIAKTVSISVRDEGPDISAARIDTIFEAFRSTENGNGSIRGGTGLGLAITRRIVEGHAGTINVKSEIGKGSTFTVDLPTASFRSENKSGQGGKDVSKTGVGTRD
jgi:signal transduction histidine kinase